MSDILTPLQRHNNMAAIKSTSTTPEIILRKSLWRRGYRYRINDKHLPGSPDLVLYRYHTVIFVHGCFWHGHKGCKYYTTPKTNTDYWIEKIKMNQKRDECVWRQLEAKGWAVIIVWECQLKKAILSETIRRVISEILENGEKFQRIREERLSSRRAYLMEQKNKREKELLFLKEFIK